MTKKKPLIIIHVRGGIVQDVECPPSIDYIVLDYDNCSECGGIDCEGGHNALAVHGKLTGCC